MRPNQGQKIPLSRVGAPDGDDDGKEKDARNDGDGNRDDEALVILKNNLFIGLDGVNDPLGIITTHRV